MKLILPLLAIGAGLLNLPAQAQWHWIDKNGRPVFSDRAPPPDIPEKNIRRQPGSRPVALQAIPLSEAATAPKATASAPAAGEDKALTARKQQAEQAEAAKRQAEEERMARLRADSCARARQAKAGLDSGVRIARTNEKGEREFLDDAARAAEAQRIDAVIASDCK